MNKISIFSENVQTKLRESQIEIQTLETSIEENNKEIKRQQKQKKKSK